MKHPDISPSSAVDDMLNAAPRPKTGITENEIEYPIAIHIEITLFFF